MKLVVADAAIADFVRLHAFLATQNFAAADRAIATLTAAIQSLETFPQRGRPTAVRGIRELIAPFGQSHYIVRYVHRSEIDELVILRIWHGRESRE